jgi:hypothetical protein
MSDEHPGAGPSGVPGDPEWRASYRELCAADSPCPPLDELASLVVDSPPALERERLADHVVRCAACADGVRDLLRLHEQARQESTCPVQPLGPRRTSWVPIGVAAALVVTAVAVDLALRQKRDVASPALTRAAALGRIESRTAEVAPARAGVVLRWELIPETPAARFDVLVSDERLEPLGVVESVTALELDVPAAWIEHVPAGSTILWRVDAALPDGTRVRGETFTLRLE